MIFTYTHTQYLQWVLVSNKPKHEFSCRWAKIFTILPRTQVNSKTCMSYLSCGVNGHPSSHTHIYNSRKESSVGRVCYWYLNQVMNPKLYGGQFLWSRSSLVCSHRSWSGWVGLCLLQSQVWLGQVKSRSRSSTSNNSPGELKVWLNSKKKKRKNVSSCVHALTDIEDEEIVWLLLKEQR